jgi:protein phosphatase
MSGLHGEGAILLLADGMGGHVDGGVAARLAVDAALGVLVDAPDPAGSLHDAATAANEAVAEHRRNIGGEISGTTLTAAVVRGGQASVVHIGDCRAYRVHEGEAEQLTDDHSWLGEEVRAGRMSAAEALRHPGRSILSRALTGTPVEADLVATPLAPGDTLVLVCDGVWEPLGDDRLAAAIAEEASLLDAVVRIISAAVTAGGTDNVTAVACRVVIAKPPTTRYKGATES